MFCVLSLDSGHVACDTKHPLGVATWRKHAQVYGCDLGRQLSLLRAALASFPGALFGTSLLTPSLGLLADRAELRLQVKWTLHRVGQRCACPLVVRAACSGHLIQELGQVLRVGGRLELSVVVQLGGAAFVLGMGRRYLRFLRVSRHVQRAVCSLGSVFVGLQGRDRLRVRRLCRGASISLERLLEDGRLDMKAWLCAYGVQGRLHHALRDLHLLALLALIHNFDRLLAARL